MTSPFHSGELAVQERAGVRELADRASRGIRSEMPEQHRELFGRLPYLVVGALDAGTPWASFLVGPAGFVSSPDARTLVVESRIDAADPIARALVTGAMVGVLGIQLETRRRNRANGTVIARTDERLEVAIEESFGNCPKYIQARAPLAMTPRVVRPELLEGPRLSDRAREIVGTCDTLFVASVSGTGAVDVSHRGGRPGFVRELVDDGVSSAASVLTLPDFPGNNFFMTLGNLEQNPRAGIAIVDFETGALLSLTGTTETLWEGPELEAFAGAERLLRFTVASGVLREGAIPLAWTPPAFSPQLTRTGVW